MPRARKNIIPIAIQTESLDNTGVQDVVVKRLRKKPTRKKKVVAKVAPIVNTEVIHTETLYSDDVYGDLKNGSESAHVEAVHFGSRNSRMSFFGKYFPLLLLVLCVILIGLVYMNKPKVYALLDTMYLIPRKETFTELYLNDYPQIPARLLLAKQTYPFTFTIRNIEGVQTAYEYEVYFTNASGTPRNISRRTIVLEDGERALIREEFTVVDPKETGTVVINLVDLKQEIHFFIPTKY